MSEEPKDADRERDASPKRDEGGDSSEKKKSKSRSRSRSRSRDRSRRKKSRSRSRERSRRKKSSRDRSRRRRRSSRSRSRSDSRGSRRRKKKSGKWDVVGDPEAAAAAAAAYQLQAQARMQMSMQNQRGCELYVGNLAIGVVTSESLKEFFTRILTALPTWNATMGPPVANVQMQSEGKYAFVKFRDEATAATAIKFDKAQLAGRAINIGRPSSYIPTVPVPQGLDVPTEMLASLQVPSAVTMLGGVAMPATSQALKKQRELYVGNLAIGVVTSQMLQGLFTAGLTGVGNSQTPPVMGVSMDSSGKFAFVEFRDEDTASTALKMFDKMEVCGRPLQVGRPSGYVDPNGPPKASMNPMGAMGAMGMGMMGMNPMAAMAGGMGMMNPARAAMISGMNPMMMQQQMMMGAMGAMGAMDAAGGGPTPTSVLVLENLVAAEELADDQEYEEIVEDIKNECSKSGTVMAVKVPRPGQGADVGKAFVQFGDPMQAQAAFQALNGRVFGGNTVKATYIPAMP